MKHNSCCHQLDTQNITFKTDYRTKEKVRKGFLPWLRRCINCFGKTFMRTLMLDPEPYICEYQNRKGEVCFRVYDPDQNVHHTFDSEDSVRIWLEERHHQ